MPRTARPILYGLTLGVLLALLLAPQSGWLVRFQALSLLRFAPVPEYGFRPLPGYGFLDTSSKAAYLHTVASEHPTDYQIQYAATPWNEKDLRTLETRFPDSASLRANVLRCVTKNGTPHRGGTEFYRLTQQPIPADPRQYASQPNDPKQLAAFDQDASIGEHLDPDNAFFPFMRAVGLYAAHKDAQAQAAMLRAGTKTQWREYLGDEVAGRVRLHTLVYNDRSAVWHATVAAVVLLPHYAKLRSTADLVTYQAMQDEQAGHITAGTALRHALLHCGGLMRAQSEDMIGTLVGIAISQTAMQRSGGAAWAQPTPTPNKEGYVGAVNPPWVATACATFLRGHGEDQLAAQVVAEDQADRQVLKILQDADFIEPWRTELLPSSRSVHTLLVWWIAGLLVLANALWLLFFGSVAWLFRRFPPVPRSFTRGRRLLTFIEGAVGLALVVFLAIGMTQGAQDFFAFDQSFDVFSPFNFPLTNVQPYLAALLALAMPLAVGLTTLLRSRRAPVTRPFGAMAVPTACVTLLLYAALVVGTARQERTVTAALQQELQGEGHYAAQETGQVWPGVVQ